MKINRLLEMALILLNRDGVTAGQLAERFGVSVRTVYRDLDELSEAGVPVYANRGAGGGISLLPGYTVNRALLSESERDDVLLALKTLQATRYPNAGAALEKIGAAFRHGGTENKDWIDICFQPWQASPDENGRFDRIKTGILENRVIAFDYVNANGEKSRRSVEPLKLVYYGNSFYLNAFCRKRNEYRQFRVTRIKNITVTNERFQPRDGGPGENFMLGDGRRAALLRLKFSPSVISRIYDYFSEETITKNPDGSCTVEVCWPEDEWVYSYILSFGDACEVLEPQHLRKIVAQRLKNAGKQYENDPQIL